MAELHGEKIDIVDWSDDPAEFVGHALSPARVSAVEVVDLANRSARVTVPDYQLSLAIGREGQNARLAARLTGWRIDIRSDNPAAPETVIALDPDSPVDGVLPDGDAVRRRCLSGRRRRCLSGRRREVHAWRTKRAEGVDSAWPNALGPCDRAWDARSGRPSPTFCVSQWSGSTRSSASFPIHAGSFRAGAPRCIPIRTALISPSDVGRSPGRFACRARSIPPLCGSTWKARQRCSRKRCSRSSAALVVEQEAGRASR